MNHVWPCGFHKCTHYDVNLPSDFGTNYSGLTRISAHERNHEKNSARHDAPDKS